MTRRISRGAEPTCMSNSEATISVSVCATHSWWDNNKPGVAKARGQPWPTPCCHQKMTAQGPLLATRQPLFYSRAMSLVSPESLCAKILTHDSSASPPSYTSRNECSWSLQVPSPGCTAHAPQHPLVKTSSERLLQYSDGANKRRHSKTNTRWNGGAGWGGRKKLCGLRTPQSLFEEVGWMAGVGGEGETREGEFSLLFQSPAGTLLQSQRCTSLRTPAELLQLPPGQTSGLTDCRDKERVSRMLCFS